MLTSPPTSLGTIAEWNAQQTPAAEAVVDGARRLTWRELHERTARLADVLHTALACVPGDRVAFIGENCLEALELYHATARAGVLFVPMNDRLAPAELEAVLDSVEPRALFHTVGSESMAEAIVGERSLRRIGIGCGAPLDYDDMLAQSASAPAARTGAVSSICFTSGTTGSPKGVLMTHEAQLEFARAQVVIEPIAPGARHLFVRGMAVAPGHRMIAWHGLSQGTTILRPRFDPGDFFRVVEAEQITNVLVAPTMLRMLLDHGNPAGHSLASLRSMVYGGAPMSQQLLHEVLNFFHCELMQGYGGSEAGQVLYLSGADHRNGRTDTNGRAVPGVSVEIRDSLGARVPTGTLGELHVSSRQLMAGDWRDPASTASVMVSGWYATGDLAEEEPDGYVRVVGRVSDMIISGGFNIMPSEVEAVIAQHRAVREVAVYGSPHTLWGEAVHAAVVLRPGETVSAEELITACRKRLASFKKPQVIEFVAEIPHTGTGKVDKRALRSQAASSSG